MNLEVSELFYSLQGEGKRVGSPTIFIRLQNCKVKFACYKLGIRCDTEFESGGLMSLDNIYLWIKKNAPNCKEITWTGGEPAAQLKEEHVAFFTKLDFYQTIETSGAFAVPENLNFISVSPKVAEHVLLKNFPKGVSELRYVRHIGQDIPNPLVRADNYFLSPHSDANQINKENLRHCINLCIKNPTWKLSVQSHKLWSIL